MHDRLLPPVPEDSELAQWDAIDDRQSATTQATATYLHPEEQYLLQVTADDSHEGYLIRLWTLDEGRRDDRVGQAFVDNRDLALAVAIQLAAAAAVLAASQAEPPQTPIPPAGKADPPASAVSTPPDEWDDEDEWQEALEDAYEEADIPRTKGTITTKTIDGRDYYYLQWREGEKVKSQYVAPVNPS